MGKKAAPLVPAKLIEDRMRRIATRLDLLPLAARKAPGDPPGLILIGQAMAQDGLPKASMAAQRQFARRLPTPPFDICKRVLGWSPGLELRRG
ncbi:MAG TPA: hypothetical protein VLA37_02155 [Sphingomonadaceae bacterium]|nr:hypothetical protein [Sphingomonadaceae bacterium]